MPVRRATAYTLLKAFGLLEFELKKISGFMESDTRGNAKVAWSIFDAAVRQLPAVAFLDRVSTETKDKILGGIVIGQKSRNLRWWPARIRPSLS